VGWGLRAGAWGGDREDSSQVRAETITRIRTEENFFVVASTDRLHVLDVAAAFEKLHSCCWEGNCGTPEHGLLRITSRIIASVTLMLTLPMCTLDSSGIARSEIPVTSTPGTLGHTFNFSKRSSRWSGRTR
jgi:hypothetical protein